MPGRGAPGRGRLSSRGGLDGRAAATSARVRSHDASRFLGALGRTWSATIEQDPAFAVRVMVDVAIRALSPAVNDPTTAVQVLNHLEDLLGVDRGPPGLAGGVPRRRRTASARDAGPPATRTSARDRYDRDPPLRGDVDPGHAASARDARHASGRGATRIRRCGGGRARPARRDTIDAERSVYRASTDLRERRPA